MSGNGLFEKIYKFLPNIKVPQSVINLLFEISEEFMYLPGQVYQMAYSKEKLSVLPIEKSKYDTLRHNLKKNIKLLESKPQNIEVISQANKSSYFSEQEIPPSLCDACILAQKSNIPIITEDFLYLKVNELETNKKAPEYCSAFALARVLYEQNKITFDTYLDFFSYLSSYRFRFLALTSDDLKKAVLGDGKIQTINVDQLRKFNFALTLSKEYGVPFENAFLVIKEFLITILIDDAILPEKQ